VKEPARDENLNGIHRGEHKRGGKARQSSPKGGEKKQKMFREENLNCKKKATLGEKGVNSSKKVGGK